MWDADQDPPQRPQRERCIPYVYAEAANDWVQAVKQRAADKGLQFDVLLQVITALTSPHI
jgi:hypothetical protein